MTRKSYKILLSSMYTLFLLFFLLRPGSSSEEVFLFEHADKWIHGMAFMGLVIILFWGMPIGEKSLMVFVVFVAIFSDVAQIYVPGRFFDWLDILANLMGVFLGLLLIKGKGFYTETG